MGSTVALGQEGHWHLEERPFPPGLVSRWQPKMGAQLLRLVVAQPWAAARPPGWPQSPQSWWPAQDGDPLLMAFMPLRVWPSAGKSRWSPKRKRSVNSRRLWPSWQRASAASPWAAAPKIKIIAQDLLASWQLRMGLEILVAQALLAGIYSCQERVLRPRKQHVSMAQVLMKTPGSSLKDFFKLKTFWSTPETSTCLFMTMSPQILRLAVCHNCLSAPNLFFHASHCQRCCCQIPVPKETGVPAPRLSATQHSLLALRG